MAFESELRASSLEFRDVHPFANLPDDTKDLIRLVGGAPLNEEFANEVGADAYCRDAAVAVELAKEFMARKHNVAA